MEILLFKTNKRINSTQVPTNGVAKSGTLKEFMSVTEPVLLLKIDNFDFNYVYIFKFKRYYFVENMVLESGNLYRLYLKVDVLASFKSEIGNQEFFIERWSKSDVISLIDSQCIAEAKSEIRISKSVSKLDKTGSYILGVVGKNGDNGVKYYNLNSSEMATFMDFMFTEANFSEWFTEGVTKALFNPMDFIASCMWIPFARFDQIGPPAPIQFGWFTGNVAGGYPLSAKYLTQDTMRIKIDKKYAKGDFRNQVFGKYSIYIPFVGEIPLDSSIVANKDFVSYKFILDVQTGKVQVWLGVGDYGGSETIFKTVEGQMGCPVQISNVNNNIITGIGGVAEAVLSGVNMDIGGVVSGAVNAINASLPQVQTKSGNGMRSTIEYEKDIVVRAQFFEARVLNPSENGYIYGKNTTINSLGSGFIKGEATSLKVICFKNEKQMINDLIKGGIYLE